MDNERATYDLDIHLNEYLIAKYKDETIIPTIVNYGNVITL